MNQAFDRDPGYLSRYQLGHFGLANASPGLRLHRFATRRLDGLRKSLTHAARAKQFSGLFFQERQLTRHTHGLWAPWRASSALRLSPLPAPSFVRSSITPFRLATISAVVS